MTEDFFPELLHTRHHRILSADAAVAEAQQAVDRSQDGIQQEQIRIAARKSERAAKFYQSAGLGLLAKEQFAVAARYYCLCGDLERAHVSQERSAAVRTYCDEDENT
ncbi:MAG: hypothetical protein EBT21_04480 [Actinobacteria bacterium]|jgi:hypothetical protein|nr:hypothetical protein [Actinomycetota bacterium]